MTLFPAEVPDAPRNRADVVPVRLARNVAPLFGVAWPDGPFGSRTWVSDFGRITLSEIARGAPLPTRSQSRSLPPPSPGPWRIVDRVVVTAPHTALPHEIANATLTGFGPDTRAAVVLTAANRLLEPVTAAIGAALPRTVAADGTPLPLPLRLAAWAGLVLEAFRSQPALVAAAIRARTIQRELVDSWRLPLVDAPDGLALTRCEMGFATADTPRAAAYRPRTLDVADATFALLRIPAGAPGVEQGDPPDRILRDAAVDVLLRRLLTLGTADDASLLWLAERAPGQLVVEALVPPTPLVHLHVRQVVRALGIPEPAGTRWTLPRVPAASELADLSPAARRAVLVAVVTVLRHVQHDPEGRDATRHAVVPLLDRLDALAAQTLAADDPVGALVRCRVADMAVQTLRTDVRNDLRGPVADLRSHLSRVQDLAAAGVIDRGAAAEAVASACVELNAVRRGNATDPDAGLPTPDDLLTELRRSWRCHHALLGVGVPGRPDPEGAIGYHLHNYAAFLAGSPDLVDVDEAVRLFTHVVLPARRAFFERTGSFRPLRHSLQVASRATTRMAQAARERGHGAAAARYAGRGLRWIRDALADDDTVRILAAVPPTEGACRLALLAAPALLTAVETGADGAARGDVETARALVAVAVRWEQAALRGGRHHARHPEVVALQHRLTALGAGPEVGATA